MNNCQYSRFGSFSSVPLALVKAEPENAVTLFVGRIHSFAARNGKPAPVISALL
jgi:hypothetical protein